MMTPFKAAAALGLITAGLAGCAPNHDSPARFVGQPVANVMATMPKYGALPGQDDKGRHFYRWNFDAVETVSVQYAHTKRVPGGPIVAGGLSFGNEERQRRCSVVAYYDPETMLTTDFRVNRSPGAKCRKMGMYLDGSAFLPTDFPG